MINQKSVVVGQVGHDTLLGLLAPATGQENLVQEPVQPLILLCVQQRLTLLEHVPGRGLVRVDCAQLASLANQANQAASPDLPNYVI